MAPRRHKKEYAKLRNDFKELFNVAKLPRERRTSGAILRRRIALKIGGCCVMIDSESNLKYKGIKRTAVIVGTGVVLRNNWIITCNHIFTHKFEIDIGEGTTLVPRDDPDLELLSSKILVRTNAGNLVTRTGEIILQDTLVDIAALRCDPLLPLLPEARLAKVDDIQSGESLYCLSYKGGVPNSFSKGYVVHPGRRTLCPSSSTQCILYHDVKLNFGSSGGALFTVDKEVVAITLACRVNCPSLGLALKASEIDRFLERVQEVESMKFAP